MAAAIEYAPFDPAELVKVLNEYTVHSKTEAYPWLAIKSLRPFYLLHILKRNDSDLPTTNKSLVFLRSTGLRLSAKYKADVADLIKQAYPKCKSAKKVLIVPLMIRPANNYSRGVEAHENMIIFNTVRSEVDRFEPHGAKTMMQYVDSDRLDRSIEKFVGELGLGLTYIPSTQVTESNEGFQLLEARSKNLSRKLPSGQQVKDPGGFCAPWSYFYADMRLKFPQLPAKELTKQIENILGRDPTKLRSFIRGQAKFMSEEVAKMDKYINFLELIKLDRKDPKWVKKKKQYDEYLAKKMEHYTATRKYMQCKLKRKPATEKPADEKPAQKPKAKVQVVTILKKIKSDLSDSETLKYLKQKDFNVNGTDQVGHSPFTMAAYHQKLKTLKYLKAQGANIHHKQKKSGDTGLSSAIYAAVHGDYDFTVVEYLLSIGLSLTDARKERPEEVALYDQWKKNQ